MAEAKRDDLNLTDMEDRITYRLRVRQEFSGMYTHAVETEALNLTGKRPKGFDAAVRAIANYRIKQFTGGTF